jgi:hypothetical protein
METRHTPGEWEVVIVHGVPIGVGVRTNAAGRQVPVFAMIGNTMDASDGPKDMDVLRANSALIAEAPAMLETIQYLLNEIIVQIPGRSANPLIKRAEASIARATGANP